MLCYTRCHPLPQALCGVKAGSREAMAARVAAGKMSVFRRDPSIALPQAFDSETNWPKCAKVINDIRDQSACGCCWAFGAAEAASDRLCVYSNGTVVVPLSAQETCFCAQEEGCNGGQLQTAWDYIQNRGSVRTLTARASVPAALATARPAHCIRTAYALQT